MHQGDTTDEKSTLVFKLLIFLIYKHNLQHEVEFKDVFRLIKQHLLIPYELCFKLTL